MQTRDCLLLTRFLLLINNNDNDDADKGKAFEKQKYYGNIVQFFEKNQIK